MKTLTVFTPTYNRIHTLPRTYQSLVNQTSHDLDWLVIDDGSSDGTREWIESLGTKEITTGRRFDWMGRFLDGKDDNHFVIESHFADGEPLRIEYVYKPNGGLYTGYNVAYQTIETELNVCIDSDDFMPEDAVEKIISRWMERDKTREYCGLVGLDFDVRTKKPIGGYFAKGIEEQNGLETNHSGDVKYIFCSSLMKKVAPQIGYKGEKDFNPHYMQMQVLDKMPILILNDNLCWVEYQIGGDSMSQAIWKQYWRSPNSYAKYRLAEMSLVHGSSLKWKFTRCVHYVSACIISTRKDWMRKTPLKLLTLFASPIGLLLFFYTMNKNVNN